ncbi:MAG: hypothetical protein AB7N91_22830 [Candidatus Tectimicrobiota bacterium]
MQSLGRTLAVLVLVSVCSLAAPALAQDKKMNPCSPEAGKKVLNPCSPEAGKKVLNPCSPEALKNMASPSTSETNKPAEKK